MNNLHRLFRSNNLVKQCFLLTMSSEPHLFAVCECDTAPVETGRVISAYDLNSGLSNSRNPLARSCVRRTVAMNQFPAHLLTGPSCRTCALFNFALLAIRECSFA